jgi:hypothetical protein
MKIARLIGGPRNEECLPMTWLPDGHTLYRGDIMRVVFRPPSRGLDLPASRIALYAFDMEGNDGSFVHLYVGETELLGS